MRGFSRVSLRYFAMYSFNFCSLQMKRKSFKSTFNLFICHRSQPSAFSLLQWWFFKWTAFLNLLKIFTNFWSKSKTTKVKMIMQCKIIFNPSSKYHSTRFGCVVTRRVEKISNFYSKDRKMEWNFVFSHCQIDNVVFYGAKNRSQLIFLLCQGSGTRFFRSTRSDVVSEIPKFF